LNLHYYCCGHDLLREHVARPFRIKFVDDPIKIGSTAGKGSYLWDELPVRGFESIPQTI
jgi:hypothetical protein